MIMLGVITLVLSSAQVAPWYGSMLPASVGEWKAVGPVHVHSRSNLFDYMNGAGELYLAYDFQEVAVRDYAKPDAPKITAEVYRMKTARDAYGVWSHDRSESAKDESVKDAAGIGQDRGYGFGLLRFWKGPVFVRILAERETPESRKAVLELGRVISRSVKTTGRRPAILPLLPQKGLIPQSAHYFHKHTVLNFHFYLSDANILDLSEKTEAVVARYQVGKDRPRLLVIRYPSDAAAKAAAEHFSRAYFRDRPASSGASRVEQVEGGEFTGIARAGRVLRLVFEAKSREQCRKLLGD